MNGQQPSPWQPLFFDLHLEVVATAAGSSGGGNSKAVPLHPTQALERDTGTGRCGLVGTVSVRFHGTGARKEKGWLMVYGSERSWGCEGSVFEPELLTCVSNLPAHWSRWSTSLATNGWSAWSFGNQIASRCFKHRSAISARHQLACWKRPWIRSALAALGNGSHPLDLRTLAFIYPFWFLTTMGLSMITVIHRKTSSFFGYTTVLTTINKLIL